MKPNYAPQGRIAFATYCDDVRKEEGNKLSFLGVYNGVLMVEAMPTLLSKLVCVINVRTPLSQPFQKLRFSITLDETEVFVQEIPTVTIAREVKLPSSALKVTEFFHAVSSVAQFVPFELKQPCVLRALVETEAETLKAGALIIGKVGDVHTV